MQTTAQYFPAELFIELQVRMRMMGAAVYYAVYLLTVPPNWVT